MTGQQLALDICDPAWTSPAAPKPRRRRQELSPSEERDLRAHGLTARQLYTITTIRVVDRYL